MTRIVTAFAMVMMTACAPRAEGPPAEPTKITPRVEETMSPKKAEVPKITYVSGGPPSPSGGYGVIYTLSGREEPAFDALIEKLLDETRVNGALSLREYIELAVAGDTERLAEVRAKGDEQAERPFFDLVLVGEGSRPVYQFFRNGDSYEGEHIEVLRRALVEKGRAAQTSPARHPDARREPEPVPNWRPGAEEE